jgi:hypothetical protein
VPAGDEGYACTHDGTTRLQCRAGVYEVASVCKGPKGCTTASAKATCDDSIGDVGDRCVHLPTDSNYACTTDGRVEVECSSGGRFETSNSCRGPKGCYIANDLVYCDQSLAREGDPCRPVDNHSCSEDAGSELKCSAERRWTHQRDCPRSGCRIANNEVYCQ